MALWMRVDVMYFTHPKVIQLHPLIQLLYLRLVAYCKHHLTDGLVSEACIKSLASDLALSLNSDDHPRTIITQWTTDLIGCGLLDSGEDGSLTIHDFLEWNNSRQEVDFIRELRSDAGKHGGRPKAKRKQNESKMKANEKQTINQTESKTEANDKANEKQTPKQNITHSTEFIDHSSEFKETEKIVKRGNCLELLAQFSITDDMKAWAAKEGVQNPEQFLPEFKDYWTSVGGKRKTGLVQNWDATFRNHIRRLKLDGRIKVAELKPKRFIV